MTREWGDASKWPGLITWRASVRIEVGVGSLLELGELGVDDLVGDAQLFHDDGWFPGVWTWCWRVFMVRRYCGHRTAKSGSLTGCVKDDWLHGEMLLA